MTNYELYFGTIEHACLTMMLLDGSCAKSACEKCPFEVPCSQPIKKKLEWLNAEATQEAIDTAMNIPAL